jgi:hypothetical protein
MRSGGHLTALLRPVTASVSRVNRVTGGLKAQDQRLRDFFVVFDDEFFS